MWIRTHVRLAVLLAFLLMGGMWVLAQGRRTGDLLELTAPTVIAGNDLGFRVESTKDGIALGRLVVRIDGQWIDAQVGSAGVTDVGAK